MYPKYKDLGYNRCLSYKIPVVEGLIGGKYYMVELELESEENRIENPYQLKIKDIFILANEHQSPKDFIQQWFFEKGHTPGDASTIAGQLSLNELELYTHTKRFIFELIQNADDMPRENTPVSIDLYLTRNFLLFLHNGEFFNREDVKAICDAAKSTKKSNLSQTGYKGIGFKSVFTDSSKVFIKSGDYSFKFDKNEGVYNDFWRLYSGYYNDLTDDAKDRFKAKYKGVESEYLQIDQIPWQIKPIWLEPQEYPEEINCEPFMSYHQVSIALRAGEEIINDSEKDYDKMISQLISEPRFLLFLRNTQRLSYQRLYPESESQALISIEVLRDDDYIHVKKNGEKTPGYLKKDVKIRLNNDDFEKAGLNFQKVIKKEKVVYLDKDGKQLDNIPEKLVNLDKTIISFAATMEEGHIVPLGKEQSILFNYLPTSDNRFGFHFLVNADFVSQTNREFIQVENSWNHYLFYNIGYQLVKWLGELGLKTHVRYGKTLISYAKEYLDLLPQNLLDETNEDHGAINKAFNNGFKEAISECPFILSIRKEIKKAEEIIIDDTGITDVLKAFGTVFFKKLTKTEKEIPLTIIENVQLKKEYLDIETFGIEELVGLLRGNDNREILRETVLSLYDDQYSKFLGWLNELCSDSSVSKEWIIDLPFIKLEENVYSPKQALSDTSIILLTTELTSISSILQKIGFNFTTFSLDNYPNLFDLISTAENYLGNEYKLYKFLTLSELFSKLNPAEKYDFLNFVSNLKNVGPSDYAEDLELFSNGAGNLVHLSHQISNKVQSTPKWIHEFIIAQDEENALSGDFSEYLIGIDGLLERVFCDPGYFEKVTSKLKVEQLDEFYLFIKELHHELPDDKTITFNAIPWLYSHKLKEFKLAKDLFCPESLQNIKDKQVYDNVCEIIESTSGYLTPDYYSKDLIGILKLGCNTESISSQLDKEYSTELLSVNQFIDWLIDDKEENFFKYNKIEKTSQNQYKISRAGDKKSYFTDNPNLIQFIAKNETLASNLFLLSKDLYQKNKLSKIGLLEEDDLLIFLIDSGFANIELAEFIDGTDNKDLAVKYISCLECLELDTNKEYDQKSNEHKFLKLAISHLEEKTDLDQLRDKIYIDEDKLTDRAVSNDIYFSDLNKELKFKLSDVITAYDNKTYSATKITEIFCDIKSKTELLKIFKLRKKNPKKIYNELKQLNVDYYNAYQSVFLLLHSKQEKENLFKTDDSFIKLFEESNEQYALEARNFIDIFYAEDLTNFYEKFELPGFISNETVITEEYAIDIEKPPKWLISWFDEGDKEEKIKFLAHYGVNDEESAVVQLRKGIKLNSITNIEKGRVNIPSLKLLANTLSWYQNYSNNNKIGYKTEYLLPIYNKLRNEDHPIEELPLSVLSKLSPLKLDLISYDDKCEFHLLNEGWGDYKQDIFSHLIMNGKKVVSDEQLGKFTNDLNVIECESEVVPNSDLLEENSDLYDAEYYKNWEYYDDFQIEIFNGGKLPFNVLYNDEIVAHTSEDKPTEVEKIIYVPKSLLPELPFCLKGILDEYDSLVSTMTEENRKENRSNYVIEYTSEEEEALKKMFRNKEVPEDFMKNHNLHALVTALVNLPEKGYKIDEADDNLGDTHEYAQLSPVYKDGKEYDVMCRSAKAGLLYMTYRAWNRLDDPNTLLYAYIKNDYHLFTSKQEVLDVNESPTDYQIVRIETDSNAENIDSILKGEFKEQDKIWIIFRVKETKEFDSLYYKKLEPDNSSPHIGARTDSEDDN
ncbi:Uncharacterised protein [Candidatus Venteria ishoeyi]|uniref:Sacsin/Nov domain-containing protein n=2 Tax=Candidatus Venteria ishoeyi TaxID=1899563 RepID=A0A1H6F4F7_9GAMM|nr:Uncharacterised protein [Candidatus Venteria ishoeyi]